VLDNHSVKLGIQGTCFAGYLTRTKRAFSTVSQEFDINPESSLWGKLFLLQHSTLGIQRSGTFLSVIIVLHKLYDFACGAEED
jgi:hypothetical protein